MDLDTHTWALPDNSQYVTTAVELPMGISGKPTVSLE